MREPFPDVFVSTIRNYLESQFGWSGRIAWNKSECSKYDLFVNPKLNLIYPRSIVLNDLRSLAEEYRHHDSMYRRFLQGLYIKYSLSPLFRKKAYKARINLSPFPKELFNCCIMPGNRSIRIINFLENECVVLYKHGYNKDDFINTINSRMLVSDLPGPSIIEINKENCWYSEDRIKGLPLNRILLESDRQKFFNSATSALKTLYKRTQKHEVITDWLGQCKKSLSFAVQKLPEIYGQDYIQVITRYINLLESNLQKLSKQFVNKNIITAVTHGDFQSANILAPNLKDKKSVYIIDWEYSKRRCLWYDAMVYDLKARFPKGLAERIREFLKSEASMKTIGWCGLGNSKYPIKFIILSFLIEDLLVRISDTTIPNLQKEQEGFKVYLNELSKLEDILN